MMRHFQVDWVFFCLLNYAEIVIIYFFLVALLYFETL